MKNILWIFRNWRLAFWAACRGAVMALVEQAEWEALRDNLLREVGEEMEREAKP